jgi:phenylacetic acid degradation operon negative regulatory protein
MLLAHIASPLSFGHAAYLARGFAKERGAAAYRAKRALERMQKKGFLQMIEGRDGTLVRITDVGAGELRLNVARGSDPKTWDGKWRMVLFDIPDAQTQLRDELRATLQIVGFLRVQNSVYVFPYPVPSLEKEIRDKNLPASQLLFTTVEHMVGSRRQWTLRPRYRNVL